MPPEPDPSFFRVETSQGRTLYVASESEAVARNAVARRKLQAVSAVPVRASEVPEEAELIGVPTNSAPSSPQGMSSRLSKVEESLIIKHPYITIALGVLIGNAMTWFALFLVLGLPQF